MPQRSLSLGFALSLVLVACQVAASPDDTGRVASSGATPGPTASAVGSSAPSSDVAASVRQQLDAATSGEQRISGKLVIGDVQATFEGTTRSNGPDSTVAMATTVGGIVSTEERVKVAGVRYVRRGEGPWLKDTSADDDAGVGTAVKEALANARDLDAGATGSAAHRLSSGPGPFDPVRFGFAAAGQALPGTATFTFVAKPDGTPVSVAIEARWTARSEGANVEASLSLLLEFVRLDSGPRISAPGDVWTIVSSERFGYAYAIPSTFNPAARTKGYDGFVGPTSSGFIVSSRSPSSGNPLDTIVATELSGWKAQLAEIRTSSEVITVAGQQARLLTVSGRSSDLGGKVTAYEALFVKGKDYYVVVIVAPREHASAALLMMRQLLATYSFAK